MSSKIGLRTLIGAAAVAAMLPVAAQTVDLTTAGNSGTINGAFFQQVPDQSTGTGVIDPFVRIQANGTEAGFNTDASGVLDNVAGIWTHSLLLSAVPIVDISGTSYYQFLLDVNQSSGGDNELLSLDQLRLYQASSGSISDVGDLTDVRYDMDAGNAGNYILLDYSLNSGSGSGDMYAYVPTANFDPTGGTYLYLYSQFGSNNPSNDGFEEWATVGVPGVIPEPSTYALMLAGLAAVGYISRRRRQE